MLKKENRLTVKDFDDVFKNGNKKFSKNFLFIKKKNDENIKISSTISKKIYKTAIQRNKCRRIIYKILQENFEKISGQNMIKDFKTPPLNFFWGIVIATKPILEINKKDLEEEILNFFEK